MSSLEEKISCLREIYVNTAPQLAVSIGVGIPNEFYVGNMDWSQIAISRSIAACATIASAHFFQRGREWGYEKGEVSKDARFMTKTAYDIISLGVIKTIPYTALLFAMGISSEDVVKVAGSAAAATIVLGRPYGWFLDWYRKRHGYSEAGIDSSAKS